MRLPRLRQTRVRAEAQGSGNDGVHQDDVALARLLRAAAEEAVEQRLAVQDGTAGVDVLEEQVNQGAQDVVRGEVGIERLRGGGSEGRRANLRGSTAAVRRGVGCCRRGGELRSLVLLLLLLLSLLRLWLLLQLLMLEMAFEELRVGNQHCLNPVKALFQLTPNSGTKTGFFLLAINAFLAWYSKQRHGKVGKTDEKQKNPRNPKKRNEKERKGKEKEKKKKKKKKKKKIETEKENKKTKKQKKKKNIGNKKKKTKQIEKTAINESRANGPLRLHHPQLGCERSHLTFLALQVSQLHTRRANCQPGAGVFKLHDRGNEGRSRRDAVNPPSLASLFVYARIVTEVLLVLFRRVVVGVVGRCCRLPLLLLQCRSWRRR